MTKYSRPLVVALALLALGASIAALYVHYRIIQDPTYTSFCDISARVSCSEVYQSRFSTLLGVPVAVFAGTWFEVTTSSGLRGKSAIGARSARRS